VDVIAGLWGRYQLRLAVGHLGLGRAHDALGYGRRAVHLLRRARGARTQLAAALNTLASCHQELGQWADAGKLRFEAVALLATESPASEALCWALIGLGDLCRLRAQYDDAEKLLQRALAVILRRLPGEAVPVALRAAAVNALGILFKDTGRYDEATQAYAEALDILRAGRGGEPPGLAAIWHNMAGLAEARGHPDEAEPLARRAVKLREEELGADHSLVARDLAVLGVALLELHRLDEAEKVFERTLTVLRRLYRSDHYEIGVALGNLAACRLARGDASTAERLFRQGLVIKQTVLGRHHPEVARQLNNLAIALGRQNRSEESAVLHREAVSILQRTLGEPHPLTVACRHNADAVNAFRAVGVLRLEERSTWLTTAGRSGGRGRVRVR
jgi:tetratricopeptide (TPR) repeat protein